MNEIIGMDDNIYRLLEAMYSNTPKDIIAYWGGHSKLLLEAMGNTLKMKIIFFMFTTRKRMQDIGSVELRLT